MQESIPRRTPYLNAKGEREPGIYTRKTKAGVTVFEIGYKGADRRQKWETVRGGIQAARAKRTAAIARVAEERSGVRAVQGNGKLTFHQAADAWWEAHQPSVRPKTAAAYLLALRHLRPVFGPRRLTEITVDDVARYVREKAAGSRPLGGKGSRKKLKGWSIASHLTVLGLVFKYASRRLGYTGQNPVSLLEKRERPGKADAKPQRSLTSDELARLIAVVTDSYRPIFQFAADTGARLAEVLGLAWGNVDTAGETVTFTHQLDKKGSRVELKTERSRRTIEVSPELASMLRELKAASAYSGRHDLVFCTRNGTGHNLNNIGSRVMGRAVKAAGLEDVKNAKGEVVEHAPTFHTLRHTHGSMLIADGWDIAEVSARLGHSSTNVTLGVYVHEFDKAKRSSERRARLARLSVVAPVETAEGRNGQQDPDAGTAEVVDLRGVGGSRQ
jgi:integrase